MKKKKYYQKRQNRKRYELPNNHRKWIGFKRGEHIKTDNFLFPREARKGDFIDIDGERYIPTFELMDNISRFPYREGIYLLVDKWIKEERNDMNQEPSIERAIFKRMTTEKGTYGYEDIIRMTAEEICKLKSIRLTHEFFQGFLEASKYYDERRKTIEKYDER